MNNELYILESDQESGIKTGNKIKSINGLSSKKIIEKLIENISGDGDGEAKQRYILSKFSTAAHFSAFFKYHKLGTILNRRDPQLERSLELLGI